MSEVVLKRSASGNVEFPFGGLNDSDASNSAERRDSIATANSENKREFSVLRGMMERAEQRCERRRPSYDIELPRSWSELAIDQEASPF